MAEPVTASPHARITREEMFRRMAELVALRSTCRRGHVGAVLVLDRRPISVGYNGAPSGALDCLEAGCSIDELGGCDRTIHAELNAIAYAARHGLPTAGTTLYSTHAPCRSCAHAIIAAGVTSFHYGKDYRLQRLDLLQNAHIEVIKWSG